MFRPRIIPVILIGEEGHAVKSIKFKNKIDLGDPVNTVNIFNSFEVDELVLLDINATVENRNISLDLLQDIAIEARMPFSVGGGINSLDDIRNILQTGAEKVIIGSNALKNPSFIKEASSRFGSSSIMVCLDIKKDFFGREFAYINAGRTKTRLSVVEASMLMEEMGAGEIIIQSIDQDGAMNGFDIKLLQKASRQVSVPTIGLGGGGNIEHMLDLYKHSEISAIACGSNFVFQDNQRGVLINYLSKEELKLFQNLR